LLDLGEIAREDVNWMELAQSGWCPAFNLQAYCNNTAVSYAM